MRVCNCNWLEHSLGNKPLTLMRYYSYGLPQLSEALESEVCLWPSLQLKGIKGKFSFLTLLFFYYPSFLGMMHADPMVVSNQRYYIVGGQEYRKDCKTWRSRSEEKGVCFSSASLILARKWESVTQSGTRGTDNLMWRKTQGSSIIKTWEDKRTYGSIQDAFT